MALNAISFLVSFVITLMERRELVALLILLYSWFIVTVSVL